MLVCVPITLTEAQRWIDEHHSHLDPPMRVVLAVSVEDEGRRCCVAVAEWPKARALNGRAVEISRVASDGTPHAASKAIGALSRALLAIGWRRLVSSTLLGEAGTSYRAAGWWPTAVSAGGSWDRPSRARGGAVQPGAKVRWEYGPDAAPRDADTDAAVREAVGAVDLPGRSRRLGPLFANVADRDAG